MISPVVVNNLLERMARLESRYGVGALDENSRQGFIPESSSQYSQAQRKLARITKRDIDQIPDPNNPASLLGTFYTYSWQEVNHSRVDGTTTDGEGHWAGTRNLRELNSNVIPIDTIVEIYYQTDAEGGWWYTSYQNPCMPDGSSPCDGLAGAPPPCGCHGPPTPGPQPGGGGGGSCCDSNGCSLDQPGCGVKPPTEWVTGGMPDCGSRVCRSEQWSCDLTQWRCVDACADSRNVDPVTGLFCPFPPFPSPIPGPRPIPGPLPPPYPVIPPGDGGGIGVPPPVIPPGIPGLIKPPITHGGVGGMLTLDAVIAVLPPVAGGWRGSGLPPRDALEAIIENAAGASTSPNSQWVKVTKTFSDFATAAFTNTITLRTFAAKEGISGLYIKTNTNFQGGGITTYVMDVGDLVGTMPGYCQNYDAKAAVGTSNYKTGTATASANTAWNDISFAGGTLQIKASCDVGHTLSQATQGSVDIWMRIDTLP